MSTFRDQCRAYAQSCGISENEAREDLLALEAERAARAERVRKAERLADVRAQEAEIRAWRTGGAL